MIRIEKVEGLVEGIIFGPVLSRRFGRSLGINPLPATRKICTFDCPYCECGRTARAESLRLSSQPFPNADQVVSAASEAICAAACEGTNIDTLTFTGNGETTLHPQFEAIVDGVVALRERLLPCAETVVLTNGTRLSEPSVRRALERIDQCVIKVDAGTESTFRRINRPLESSTLEAITAAAAQMSRVIVQTMFVRGIVDNTLPSEIEAWIERLARIRPRSVQIYSLERKPAEVGLIAVEAAELKQLAELASQRTNLPIDVY